MNILVLIVFTSVIAFGQEHNPAAKKIKIYPDTLSSNSDSIITSDSLLIKVQQDSIVPLYSSPLTEKSFIASNKELLKREYQYTGDYLRLFPFSFIKDLGFTGQPNETFFYGVGNDAVSYLIDGVSLNDRYSNSLNLNLIQSEDIDSIELNPLPRGFIYGAYNNPVSVNFITKDFITSQPYSRIRFYQGTNRDMMFDGSFNALVMKRLIASFDIANRILDATYKNTDYAIWQGKLKLKYLLSNKVNIIASYNYNDYNAGYSGGVDVDSIRSITNNIDDVLYDFRAAPMVYPNGELKTLTHLPRLRFLVTPFEWLKTDASLYYLFNRYEKKSYGNEYVENTTYGLNIRNEANYNIFNFRLNFDYENIHSYINKSQYNMVFPSILNSFNYVIDSDLLSVSGIVSAFINDSSFIPSIFYKTSSLNDFTSNGYGIDLLLKLKSNIAFYFGGSVVDGYYSNDINFALIELGAKYHNDFMKIDLKYFINDYTNGFYTGGIFFDHITFGKLKGLRVNLKFNYWKLLLESNSSYYTSQSNKLFGVPNYQTQTGLYYTSKLFNDNLDLKTGFVFYYTGKNNVFTNEHGVLEVPSSNKLDFTLAGEIQKTAIVYFLWQNLLGNNYYLTPYYPMPSRSIRFGVAWELFN